MRPSDDRLTPPEIADPLQRVFGELWDPCPYPKPEWSGLTGAWHPANYVNPPYSRMYEWALKALEESRKDRFVAFILPNDATTRAYQVLENEAWGCWRPPFRVKFLTPEGRRVDVARSHAVFFLGGLQKWR
jgi:hypothetical protein